MRLKETAIGGFGDEDVASESVVKYPVVVLKRSPALLDVYRAYPIGCDGQTKSIVSQTVSLHTQTPLSPTLRSCHGTFRALAALATEIMIITANSIPFIAVVQLKLNKTVTEVKQSKRWIAFGTRTEARILSKILIRDKCSRAEHVIDGELKARIYHDKRVADSLKFISYVNPNGYRMYQNQKMAFLASLRMRNKSHPR